MSKSTIVTGQYVELEQNAASFTDRIVARLVDYAIIIAYTFFAFFVFRAALGMEMPDDALMALMFLLGMPLLLYHPLMEIFHHGQSIGKQVMKIRVVNQDGTAPSVSSYLLRFILSPIDIDLFCLGLPFIILTPRHQRLGDLAAGTMVIKLENKQIYLPNYSYTAANYTPTYSQAIDLRIKQAELISRVLYYNKDDRQTYINSLAMKVQNAMQVIPQVGHSPEVFLRVMLDDYYYYCSTIEA